MTTMGVGLFYESKKTAKQVSDSIDKKSYLHTAETCVTEAVRWLRSDNNTNQCETDDMVCNTIQTSEGEGMRRWSTEETGKRGDTMERLAYSCTITRVNQDQLEGGRTKSHFKILSNGYDSTNAERKTTIEVIVSIIL
jgi:hypothetical protein